MCYHRKYYIGAVTEDYPVDYHGSIKNADEAMFKQKLARKQRIGS